MRFTSLIVELIRARPALIFWVVVLVQACMWILIPSVLYSSPPGDIATTLAYGREYLLGPVQGPPLAYWLADVAFSMAGNNLVGVFVLSQICFVAACWSIFRLGAAILGEAHAAITALLTVTITAFSFPNVEFGPHVLAQPFWAATLLSFWRIVSEGERNAWFSLSLHAGLLLLTTVAAPLLLAMLVIFALATARGRSALKSFDPFVALAVIAVLTLPFAMLQARADGYWLPAASSLGALDWFWRWLQLLGMLLLAASGIALLAILNSSYIARPLEHVPAIFRAAVDPLGRSFIYYIAIAPLVILTLVSAVSGSDAMLGGPGLLLLPAALAVTLAAGDLIYLRRQRFLRMVWLSVVAAPAVFVIAISLLQPWIAAKEVPTMLPARAMGEFFADSFQRRTGQPLRAVAGDPQLASLIGYAAPGRPHLLLDAAPERTPWISIESFAATGGLIVWRATDTSGLPPPDITQRFPGLVPEVPRSFQRFINGRQPLMRVGWAIMRPRSAAPPQ